ncbi:phosphate ABC transporter permease PstA [Haloferacaceae archaeon DSL9]
MSTQTGPFGDIESLGVIQRRGRIFLALCIAASLVGIVSLVVLIADVLYEAWGWLDLQFLTTNHSRFTDQAGFFAAIVGSVYVLVLTALFSFVIGVGSAIYLEEYAPNNRTTRVIEANLANLAGVPSVVYGLLALSMFANGLNLGGVVLVGALALSLLIVPIIIVSTQEALRAVPDEMRHGSLAAGATRWQTIRHVVLPAALPGIMTGNILALSRAIGETAPLIMIGALLTARRAPDGILGSFGAMPMQIYYWARQPQAEFHHLAAAGIVVLLVVMLLMNATAIYVRNKYDTKV